MSYRAVQSRIASRISRFLSITSCALAALALLAFMAAPRADTGPIVLRMVPQTNITILDPIWTTANVTRNHGYMIYDTLFGTDADGKIKPQMVDKWSTSKDGKTWTFTLRSGLAFHDGAPVTSDDVIASLKRWSSRDSFGGVLAQFVDHYEATDPNTFRIVLKEPFGLVIEALGKPSSNVPFIMPKRVADTPGDQQIKEMTGSGPYIFKSDEYRPGERVVYIKNPNYKPRDEPASGTTGGKRVYVDRVEWVIIRDPQTQLNALLAGEVDLIEEPAAEQYPTLRASPSVELVEVQPAGGQFIFRFNHLFPPFNDVRIRRAAMVALGEEQILKTQVGVPGLYQFCKSMYPCGSAYASDDTAYYTGVADPKKAHQMLQEAGYTGTPVVLMRPTDLAGISKLPLVAKQQLEQAGFVVDLQTMDWQTLVARRAKKDPPNAGGWNAFMTSWNSADVMNPVTMAMMNARGQKGWFGWEDDPQLEDIKGRFVRATSDAERKKLAEQAQLRAFEIATHAPLGQFHELVAVRRGVVSGLVRADTQVYWNIKKN
ncbi:MAG: ABC transporter substrate-binding protein [Burkholderiaceae bacterium]